MVVALPAGLIDMSVMARSSKLLGMLKPPNAVTGEVVGGVVDKEHVEGLLEVANHTGAFTGKKWRQNCT